MLIQEIGHIQINQPVFPGVFQTYVTDITAWYLYAVGRITEVGRSVSPLVDQAVVVPFQVQGVFEGMLQLFD